MKKLMSIVLGLLFAGNAFGEIGFSGFTEVADKYADPNSGNVLYRGLCLQSGFNVALENGLYVGGFFSHSPDGSKMDLAEEYDHIVGYSGEMPGPMCVIPGMKYDVSATYYDEPRVWSYGKGDIWCFSATASAPVGKWICAWNVKNYQPEPDSGFPPGWIIGYGVERTFELGPSLSLATSTKLNWGHGNGLSDGLVFCPSAGVGYSLSDSLTWTIVRASGFIQVDTNDPRENEGVLTTGFGICF